MAPLRLSLWDDLALAVGLVLVSLALMTCVVLVVTLAPEGQDRTIAVTGLVNALVAMAAFWFKGKTPAR